MNVQKRKQNGLPVLWRRWGWWQRDALRLLKAFPPAFLCFCARCSFTLFVFPCFLSPCDEALRTVLASPFKLRSGFCVMFVLMFVYSSFNIPSLSGFFCSPLCFFCFLPFVLCVFFSPSPLGSALSFFVPSAHPFSGFYSRRMASVSLGNEDSGPLLQE